MSDYDALKLENQLCFPLYACAKEITRRYKPFLDRIGLTYTQYITMMVLWEEHTVTMHDLGKRLYLDSGTLTPVLKKLESMGYLKRRRKADDERVVVVEITKEGEALREEAEKIPYAMGCLVNKKGTLFTLEEAEALKEQLYRILRALE